MAAGISRMRTRRALTDAGIGLTGTGDLSERSKDDICDQLIRAAYDRFGSIATEDGKAKRPLTSASPQNRTNSGSSRHVRLVSACPLSVESV